MINPVHRRLAELHYISRKRNLTDNEITELQQCLHANANLVRRLDELKQLAYIAYVANDIIWFQDIGKRIEKLEGVGK